MKKIFPNDGIYVLGAKARWCRGRVPFFISKKKSEIQSIMSQLA